MIEIVDTIGNTGIAIVVSGAFIWLAMSNAKTLELLSKSNQSIAKSLELLESQMGVHDCRAIEIKQDTDKILTIVERGK